MFYESDTIKSTIKFICSLAALLTPLPVIPFTTEEITGCSNEAAKGANKSGRNFISRCFILCFTVSIIHLNLLMILLF